MIKELTIEKVNLPVGWEMKKLIELGEVQTGTTPSTSKKEFYGDFIPFVKPPHFNPNGTINFSSSGLSKIGLTKGRLIKENSILMVCIGASIGKTGITLIPISCNQQINAFTPNENCLPKFYYHLLSSDYFFKKVMKRSSQATLPMINKTKWQDIEIPLPPLSQQKQIVAILDKAFAAIDTAKGNAQQNLQNSKELFESYLQDVFENKGDNWEEKTIGDLGKPSMCKRILKQQTSSDGDIPFYKIGTFGKTPNAFISKELYEEYKTKYSFPKKGDILLSASGTIGRRVIYDGKPAFFQDSNIVWIDNDEKQVLNEYLYSFYGFCDWNPSKGATISRLYNANLKRIKITFPNSIEEQKRIVQKLDALSTETKKLETIYTQKIADLEELKKSVLQKAFSGQLI